MLFSTSLLETSMGNLVHSLRLWEVEACPYSVVKWKREMQVYSSFPDTSIVWLKKKHYDAAALQHSLLFDPWLLDIIV